LFSSATLGHSPGEEWGPQFCPEFTSFQAMARAAAAESGQTSSHGGCNSHSASMAELGTTVESGVMPTQAGGQLGITGQSRLVGFKPGNLASFHTPGCPRLSSTTTVRTRFKSEPVFSVVAREAGPTCSNGQVSLPVPSPAVYPGCARGAHGPRPGDTHVVCGALPPAPGEGGGLGSQAGLE